MTYHSHRHNRRSIRLKGYDYSHEGAYFITTCTFKNALLFVKERYCNIVKQCLLEIPVHFPNIELDAWIIMPNHVHAILVINDRIEQIKRRGTACRAPTSTYERFGKPTMGSLPTIIRSFKSAATKRINAIRETPGTRVWQRNYYEHVIRNDEEFNIRRRYLLDNPVRWDEDEYNPNRLTEVCAG